MELMTDRLFFEPELSYRGPDVLSAVMFYSLQFAHSVMWQWTGTYGGGHNVGGDDHPQFITLILPARLIVT
ncbi:hypothetical protein Eco16F5M1D1_1494 [Escherichia coli O8:H8]|nr:hypothetical protein Eco16F5M1D1_1494 [Escherichia coli O8:H8]